MNRQAVAALDAARPAIARLDRSRHAEELAADLIESWSGVETALRSLLGGTALAGQNLIREARGRQLITLDQANALAAFHAARERAENTQYQPSDADINAAREGFLKFEAALMTPAADASPTPSVEPMSTKGLRHSPLGIPQPVPPPDDRRPWWFIVAAVVAVVLVGAGGWYLFMRDRGGPLARGVEYYQRGQRELAVGEFTRAARDDPQDALPHVYLSRMAREAGNMPLAGQEAQAALRADSRNATALREMGSYLLAAGNNELARRFYVRAIQEAPTDRAAQGFLGCALIRLGRYDEGMRWVNRAGQGSWSGCATAMPGMMPPGSATAPAPR